MQVSGRILAERGACSPAVEAFEREWPSGCELTREVVLRAHELGLPASWWAARNLLSTAQARTAYEHHAAVAQQALAVTTAAAWRAYRAPGAWRTRGEAACAAQRDEAI